MVCCIFKLVIFAGILGIIIALMEQGEFPGWGKMVLCVLASIIPTALINALLPPYLFIIGSAVGAVCAGFAISAACGMDVKRATIAASIYLAIEFVLELLLLIMMAKPAQGG